MENIITREILQQIWDQHGLGLVETMHKPAQGVVNYSLILNDRYVIRFDAMQDADVEHRYRTEELFYTRLRGILPVPEVIALDESKTLVPCMYIILSKLPGEQIVRTWQELTTEQQAATAFQAGVYLAEMHNVMLLDDFGDPGYLLPGWVAFVDEFAERYLQESARIGILDETILKRIRQVVQQAQPLLNTVQRSVLVHSDYHFENVLQRAGQVTGVIDVEWGVFGDPAWDFRVEDEWEMTCPGSRAALYAGYQSRRGLRDHHEQVVALYKMLLWLDHVSMGDANPMPQDPMKFMLAQLAWLEANLD